VRPGLSSGKPQRRPSPRASYPERPTGRGLRATHPISCRSLPSSWHPKRGFRPANDAGWQIAIHATGDGGVDLALDAFDALGRDDIIAARDRIEQASRKAKPPIAQGSNDTVGSRDLVDRSHGNGPRGTLGYRGDRDAGRWRGRVLQEIGTVGPSKALPKGVRRERVRLIRRGFVEADGSAETDSIRSVCRSHTSPLPPAMRLLEWSSDKSPTS
jgi:hypothetical protein